MQASPFSSRLQSFYKQIAPSRLNSGMASIIIPSCESMGLNQYKSSKPRLLYERPGRLKFHRSKKENSALTNAAPLLH
jgi:hypothetical protein